MNNPATTSEWIGRRRLRASVDRTLGVKVPKAVFDEAEAYARRKMAFQNDALAYCYDRGFFWEENGIRLYDVLDRVSCWCCANKNLKELRNIRTHLPKYWNCLKDLQSRTDRPMKGPGKSVFDLEERFGKEAAK
jgi:hypothetical protein